MPIGVAFQNPPLREPCDTPNLPLRQTPGFPVSLMAAEERVSLQSSPTFASIWGGLAGGTDRELWHHSCDHACGGRRDGRGHRLNAFVRRQRSLVVWMPLL
jgi:hypothetical protein